LDPKLDFTGGHDYWRTRLRPVAIRLAGHQKVEPGDPVWRRIAEGVMVVEFFPYRSVTYRQLAETVPSQEFGFHLVRKALESKALIVITRGLKPWVEQIPGLGGDEVLKPWSPRSGLLSMSHIETVIERL
jgi:hypothetical protein